MSQPTLEDMQRAVCARFGAEFCRAPPNDKLGIATNVQQGLVPVNGLRHRPVGTSTGWYVWSGEQMSDEADDFKPLHVAHVGEWCPKIEKYLGLAPGWRFLIAGDYEDVWFDLTLLDVV